MVTKLMAPVLLILGLGVTACGSGGSTSAGASAHASHPHSHRPAHVYRVVLTGKAEPAHGASGAAGHAVIAIHGHTRVCWRFAHLHGFRHATDADVRRGPAGKSGPMVLRLSTASRLRHHGCTRTSLAVIKAIERHPEDYYVNVYSAQHRAGAVRGQL